MHAVSACLHSSHLAESLCGTEAVVETKDDKSKWWNKQQNAFWGK